MLHDDRLEFKPYPDVIWDNMAVCLVLCLVALFLGGEGRLIALVFVGCLSALVFIWAFLKYITIVTISSAGIGVKRWNYESVPMTGWDSFACAYLLDVNWTQSAHALSRRYCAYYLLLTKHELRGGDVRELGRKLAGAYPCGKWWGHVALRLIEEQTAAALECIGQSIPVVKKTIERDESIRL